MSILTKMGTQKLAGCHVDKSPISRTSDTSCADLKASNTVIAIPAFPHAMNQRRPKPEDQREERIANEIIVDCYNEHEASTGWYCYLENKLAFPFEAECIKPRKMSPLKLGERETVLAMLDDEGDDLGEMMVEVEWRDRTMGIPLAQIKVSAWTRKQPKPSRTGIIRWRKDGSSKQ